MAVPPALNWVLISPSGLATAELTAWATRPECGAVVTFAGTVRHSSEDRDDIVALEYETSADLAIAQIEAVIAAARARWTSIVAVAIHHRTGRVEVGDSAVVVVVSAPHRHEAFAAAEYCMDALKESVPIYKRDVWPGGSAWSNDARPIVQLPRA
jgi:molybdopterin synthase catalytic subunit